MEGLRKKHETFEETQKKKIAKLGKLDLSSSQAKDKTIDELYDMALSNIDKSIEENKTATDEKITKELNDLKLKHSEALKTLEEKEREFNENLTNKEKEWQEQSYSKDAKAAIRAEVTKRTYITDKEEALEDLYDTLTDKIYNKCKIMDFKTLDVLQPDGVSIIAFTPSDIAKTLPQVVDHVTKPWVAVSQKGDDNKEKKPIVPPVVENSPIKSGLEAMTERYEQMTSGKPV